MIKFCKRTLYNRPINHIQLILCLFSHDNPMARSLFVPVTYLAGRIKNLNLSPLRQSIYGIFEDSNNIQGQDLGKDIVAPPAPDNHWSSLKFQYNLLKYLHSVLYLFHNHMDCNNS